MSFGRYLQVTCHAGACCEFFINTSMPHTAIKSACPIAIQAVRRRPFQIVLLDEVEKAHRNVLTVLLQLLDDGRLTDSHGRVVDFSNTIVIMTTNLGAQYLLREAERRGALELEAEAAAARAAGVPASKRVRGAGDITASSSEGGLTSTDMDVVAEDGSGVSSGKMPADTVSKVMGAIRTHFLPELLNRIDSIVLFEPLTRGNLREIVRHQVLELGQRLADRDVDITVTTAALDQVLRESYNASYGARPCRRYIDKHLATELARLTISGALLDHSTVAVTAGTEPGKFSYAITRKPIIGASGVAHAR